jgi:hypothetical protein
MNGPPPHSIYGWATYIRTIFAMPLASIGIDLLLLVTLLTLPAAAANVADPEIEDGFRAMYNLEFVQAEREFAAFERQHADNPIGPVAEAADLLFGEFQRLGVLQSQFYQSDSAFAAREKLSTDPAVRERFNSALQQGEQLARARLSGDATDRDALFALSLASGLRADYLGLIEKRKLASLHYAKQASAYGKQLLSVHPDCYDAHLAIGVSQYLTGRLAAPLRWIVRLGGANPDKQGGMVELKLTAERGELLAPFARILLAIAYVRDRDKSRALAELEILRQKFPANPLFVTEIARLEKLH